ncbi:unnamed protein product [Schistosoma mattheei]|uniref:CS domain-containing protein n=1 Tax=Schistosoma mattheei TaxID=31246 RepID=A0A183Q632_9TREM|nr:unnamed protein product [Schistosoma mattheei]
MTNVNIQYDNALLGILQNEGKTDFFYIMTPEQKKIGFPPGVSIEMILKIPENVDARNISVNIERKHIRVSIQKEKKEIFCFDGDLCWEIHKNDAIWTFHSKENQVSHQSIAYTSCFYVRNNAKMNLSK